MYPTINTEKLAVKIGFLQKRRTGYGKIPKTTLVDIQDWLREIHKIHCSVAPWRDCSNVMSKDAMYEGNVIDENDDWNVSLINSFYKDHYYCLEACINHSLQILKNRHGKETEK